MTTAKALSKLWPITVSSRSLPGDQPNAPQWAYPNTDISSSSSRKVLSKTGGENPQDKSPPP